MRNSLRTLLIAALLTASCGRDINGSGTLAEEARTVGDFRRVAFSDGLRGSVEPGEKSVTVSVDDNLLPELETVVESGTLKVGFRNGVTARPTSSDIRIRNPQVEGLDLSGGSRVTAVLTTSSLTELNVSGGSDATVRGAQASRLVADVSGGSRVSLDGTGETLVVNVSGGSRVDSTAAATDVEVNASGGSEVRANASRSVRCAASGGSRVTVVGNPSERSVDTSSDSTVTFVDGDGGSSS